MAKKKTEPIDDFVADMDHLLMYRGTAGQQAVISELLYRGINVADVYVDVGEDAFTFTVKEKDRSVTRVQVKHATAKLQKNDSYFAEFYLPWEQFATKDQPPLVYILPVRLGNRWSDFLVIRRLTFQMIQKQQKVGTESRNTKGERIGLKLRLVFTTDDVMAKGVSLQPYRDAFLPWPPRED